MTIGKIFYTCSEKRLRARMGDNSADLKHFLRGSLSYCFSMVQSPCVIPHCTLHGTSVFVQANVTSSQRGVFVVGRKGSHLFLVISKSAG